MTKDPRTTEWPVDRILSHSGRKRNALFEIKWKAGDKTWLPYDQVEHLEPLKVYFEALGVDSIDKLPDNLLPPPIDDPQVLLACLKPSDELINGHSNAMSTDTELLPYTPSDGGFKQFENLIDVLICQLEHNHKPSDTPILTMSYSRVDGSFSFFNPLHRVKVEFECHEADLIFEFADSSGRGTTLLTFVYPSATLCLQGYSMASRLRLAGFLHLLHLSAPNSSATTTPWNTSKTLHWLSSNMPMLGVATSNGIISDEVFTHPYD